MRYKCSQVCVFSMYLVDLHGLDLACVSYMGTSAQVNQGPTSNQNLNMTTLSFIKTRSR